MKTKFKVGDYVFIRLISDDYRGVIVGQITRIVYTDDYPYKINAPVPPNRIRIPYYSRKANEIQKLTESELAWYLVTNNGK